MRSIAKILHGAMADMLRRKGIDAVEVISYYENRYRVGNCDTCGYDTVDVVITYLDGNGNDHRYDYSGYFSDLINELVDGDE
jgi:hypothetical protein